MRRVIVLLVLALTVPVVVAATPACGPEPEQYDATVTSADGTPIAITVFRPAGVCAARPVPLMLTMHGLTGSRATDAGDSRVAPYLAEGWGVVTMDARGHGDSGGLVLIAHPQHEVQDWLAVLDWAHDELPWVARERASGVDKDIVVGAHGFSYGGGFQLMTAAYDDRLDALVPEGAWNSLVQAAAPNGALRSDYLAALYAVGKTTVDFDPRIDQWLAEAMVTNRMPDAAVESFTASSPFHRLRYIDAPVLLVHGMPDTLLPLNQAVANDRGLRNAGNEDVWIRGFNGGHLLPGIQPTGVNAPARGARDDCGDLDAFELDFLRTFLAGDREARARLTAAPRIAVPTEQGTCVTGADWPLTDERHTVGIPAVAVPQVGGSILVPLLTAEEETTVAGIPRFRATAPLELDDIFYASLVLERADGLHVVHDQVMGARTQLASVEGTFAFDLGGVATTLQPGETLYLRLDGANEQYAVNGRRVPGAAVFTDVAVTLPLLPR